MVKIMDDDRVVGRRHHARLRCGTSTASSQRVGRASAPPPER